mgnify:CR=1 FL=1|jgi:putative hemolysin
MPIRFPEFATRLANSDADFHAVQGLRYKVFVEELGGSGTGVDHERQIESDPFDAFCDHLMLSDPSGRLVGVYRLMTNEMAEKAGGFYSESEFDVSGLLATVTSRSEKVFQRNTHCPLQCTSRKR